MEQQQLPELEGTERQVYVANKLRLELIERLNETLDNLKYDVNSRERFLSKCGLDIADVEKAINYLINDIVDAEFYFDNRYERGGRVIIKIAKLMGNPIINDKILETSPTYASLPELKGTEKQVKWANNLRDDLISAVDWIIVGIRNNAKGWGTPEVKKYLNEIEEVKKIIQYIIANKTDAKFYIDNRETHAHATKDELLSELAKEME